MTQYRDLSKYHYLVDRIFPKISAQEAWERYRLSEEQVDFYIENGYIHNIQLLDDNQIELLKKELAEIADPAHPKHDLFYEFHSNEAENSTDVLFHSLGHWRISPGFHDVLWNPKFVVAASQLLGNRSVRFWHDQLFCKPAYHGGVVAWHQDYSYWTRTVPTQHLSCWVGLDQATKDNGCLHYIPKSHRWNLLDRTQLAGAMNGIEAFLDDQQKMEFENKVAIEMEPGYASFHHPLLVHGSYENRSSNPRRAFVLNVCADGTQSNTDQELLQGVPPFKVGEKLAGQFFPLIFDRQELITLD